MKSLLFLSLLILSTTSLPVYEDECGADLKDGDSYIQLCISDASSAGSDDASFVSFYYSSTDGNLYTTDLVELDTEYCDDYESESCNYYDIVPSDMAVLHNLELYLDGSDGVQYGQISVKYGDGQIAMFDGVDDNDCVSSKGFGDEYPQFITLDENDVCQSTRIFFSDPDANGDQTTKYVAADNGRDGDECQCDQSDYAFSAASGYCDTCYFVCNDQEECEVVTENCGTNFKYTDNYMKVCTSWHYMADSGTDFQVRWNYNTATENGVQTEYAEGDNMLCDDFVLGKCDYFDDVPTDAISINYVDFQKRGTDGWQFALVDIYSMGNLLAGYGGYNEQNECVTVYDEKYYGNNDGDMVWVDEDDICYNVRIHFVDGIATTVYAIDECNCDLDPAVWSVGLTSGDYDSCAAICDPEGFEAYNNPPGTCDVVTIYSECDYTGEEAEVETELDCLTWQPQSICVPEGYQATLYDLCWYAGDSTTFTASESCMSANGLFLLESNKKQSKHAHITVSKV